MKVTYSAELTDQTLQYWICTVTARGAFRPEPLKGFAEFAESQSCVECFDDE